jgi:hypothetical protein
MIPGIGNLEENAVPTVFDGLLGAPTYLLIRGQETNPDTKHALAPGVPQLLAGDRFQYATVQLPIEGSQPASRPGIIETYVELARREVAAAKANLQEAQQQREKAEEILAHWESQGIPEAPPEPSADPGYRPTSAGSRPWMVLKVRQSNTRDHSQKLSMSRWSFQPKRAANGAASGFRSMQSSVR